MAENTNILWCDSTFNPWIGCTQVSPLGCAGCYAKAEWDDRRHRVVWGPGQARSRTKTWGDPVKWNQQQFFQCSGCGRRGTEKELAATDERGCDCHKHMEPVRRRVFCASLADVFDNEVPVQWRMDLFRLIADTPNLDWLVLTKRVGNVMKMCSGDSLMFDLLGERVWLGITVVNCLETLICRPSGAPTPMDLCAHSMADSIRSTGSSSAARLALMPVQCTQTGLAVCATSAALQGCPTFLSSMVSGENLCLTKNTTHPWAELQRLQPSLFRRTDQCIVLSPTTSSTGKR